MAALCKMSVLRVYQDVIDDVIHNVSELFLEDGVDEQVLQELKQAWEAKLHASKAIGNKDGDGKAGVRKPDSSNGSGFVKVPQNHFLKQVVGQVPPNNHVQTPVAQVVENKMVPIQITLPAQAGSDLGPRTLTIQVPALALQGNQLHKILSGPVITATMSLPQALAATLLQQHVNAAFASQQQTVALVNKTVIQTDGALDSDTERELEACSSKHLVPQKAINPNEGIEIILSHHSICTPATRTKPKVKRRKQTCKIKQPKLEQVDGPQDTSDDDEASEEDEASDDAEEDKDEEENEMDNVGPEDEPLNSEDDVSEEDPGDLFETDNVIVCQYDKITRSRNKWKFHLKDGVMNLDGEDYVFQKANGDAEW